MLSLIGRGGGVCLVLALGAWGCLGSDPELLSQTPRNEAADALAEAICRGAESCCTALEQDKPSEVCRSTARNDIMKAIIFAEGERREVVADAIDACVAAFEAASETAPTCIDLPSAADLDALCPDLFSAIPEGKKAPGERCEGTFDCASPSLPGQRGCVPADGSIPICVWYLDRALGESCAPSPTEIPRCAADLACAPDSRNNLVCAEAPGSGAACTLGDGTCATGLSCEETSPGIGVCQPWLVVDASCGPMVSGSCEPGASCVSGRCQKIAQPAQSSGSALAELCR
ncbi:MAG: hypothetical protein JNL21_00850 [Myxococcales bacterium]|nr:hypothetical protein [Myxococcales bacterium]